MAVGRETGPGNVFTRALELFLRLGFVSGTGQKERWSSSWDSWKLDKLVDLLYPVLREESPLPIILRI